MRTMRVRLQRPDEPPQEDPTFYPRLLEDEVLYDDLSPWPTGADGSGLSLQRTGAHALGNDPASWQAKSATPGAVDFTGAVIGDFDGDRRVDQLDIALLCRQMQAASDLRFDLSGDGLVDFEDVSFLVKTVLQTSFGDANLDGIFNSADVIEVFVAGQYEDAVVGNATWDTGDWDCDGEFNSSDLILAFSDGGYVAGAQPVPPRATSRCAPPAVSLLVSSGPSPVRTAADVVGHSTLATLVPRTVERQVAAQVFAERRCDRRLGAGGRADVGRRGQRAASRVKRRRHKRARGRDQRSPRRCPALVTIGYAASPGAGSLCAARPSMTSDQPLSNMSMPTNRPMTHRPDNGHCRQMEIPSSRLTTPCSSNQPQCW